MIRLIFESHSLKYWTLATTTQENKNTHHDNMTA